MALVIVAGVLGVITICGGLFLRRLLGEVAELRRQITRFDRQMRAQRARETFLRQLIAYDGEEEGDWPPVEAAVVNGHRPTATPLHLEESAPVRRKKHLGLYLGGAVAALVTVSTAARHAVRAHGGQVIGAATATAVTAATVTLVTVQPWSISTSPSPAFAPTASISPTWRPSTSPSQAPSVSALEVVDAPSPDGTPSPARDDDSEQVPADDDSPAASPTPDSSPQASARRRPRRTPAVRDSKRRPSAGAGGPGRDRPSPGVSGPSRDRPSAERGRARQRLAVRPHPANPCGDRDRVPLHR